MANRPRLREVLWAIICLSVCVAATPADTPANSGTIALLSQKQLDQVATLVEGDKADFSGVSVDEARHAAYVYEVSSRSNTTGTQATLARVKQVAASQDGSSKVWAISYLPVRYSFSELEATKVAIATQQPWVNDARPYIAGLYVDPTINAVHLGVTAVTPQLAGDVKAFGNLVRLNIEARPTPASRYYDSPPWYGGDDIGCTAGFPAQMRSNSRWGMLTAGHCFNSGATVYQASSVMGVVTWRVYGGGNTDAAFIDASSYGGVDYFVFTSEFGTNIVDGLAGGHVGAMVCFDGKVTGENCNGKITSVNGCYTYLDGQWVCGIDRVQSMNGSVLVQPGDSGGPVYFHDATGGLTAEGLISSFEDGGLTGYFVDYANNLYQTFKIDCSPSCP